MRSPVVLLVLLAALTLFTGLGRPAITDSDEAFYAEAGREMVDGGDWLTPHFNYQNRLQKPILFYWVVASHYALAGVGEAAARAGSAAAGLGIVLIAFWCGRRWYDQPTGLLAGAIIATSFGCAAAARLCLPDLPLAFFITLATWAAFVAIVDRQRPARRWWLLAALAAALGFLTKGPVALVVPTLVVIGPVLLERGWRRIRALDLVLAAGLFAAVSVPWYAAMAATHGAGYLRGFFVGDNLERFATTTFNAHRSIGFYIPIVLGGMLPWSLFFALWIAPLWRSVRQRRWPVRVDVRLLSWALMPLLLFTASVGKQPRYILPMLAPLGLLLAAGIRRAITTPLPLPDAQPRLFRWMAGLSGFLLALLAGLLWRARPLLAAVPPDRLTAVVALMAVSGLAVAAIAASRYWRRSVAAVVVAAALSWPAFRLSIFSVPDLDPVEQMAASVLAHRQSGEPVGTYHVFVRNLVYYTHVRQTDLSTREQLVPFLDTPDRVLCVLPKHELDDLEAAARRRDGGLPPAISRLRRLESITYFDAATAKIGALLRPDPETGMRTVVLVANR